MLVLPLVFNQIPLVAKRNKIKEYDFMFLMLQKNQSRLS